MPAKKKSLIPESSFDDMFEAATDEAKKQFPDLVYTGDEDSMRRLCLAVPSLAIRYTIQQEGWPLGLFVLLDGPKESCKSSLSYEIIRWTRMAKGRGTVIEVEDKRSPDLCMSINNYDAKAFAVHYADTLQDWQEYLSYWVKTGKLIMDGDPSAPKSRPGIGRCYPLTYVVDAITSAVGEGTKEQIEKDGHTTKHFAVDAGLLSEYCKFFTKEISGFPMSVIGINHIKEKNDPYTGALLRHMPGGKAPEYHAALDIEMRRKGKQWQTADEEGITLTVTVQKNSTAPHAAIKVEVDMVWYYDLPTEQGERLQRTFFDWHAATWDILNRFDSGAMGDARKKQLRDIIRFSIKTKRVTCELLGLESESMRVAGKALEQHIAAHDDFASALYGVLGIHRRPIFVPGIDYREQVAEACERVATLQASRQKHIAANPSDLIVGSVFDDTAMAHSDAEDLGTLDGESEDK